ncbi:MAG: flagellar basal body rod protein FlgB [Leptolinea sp.]|jgi:flagellar basal-body rod protein FlgB|nr:flagellar basal body rod protein FlgB [Leptolinea sp.]
MSDPVYGDSALNIASKAMDGLSYRKNVISQNVANVDTPGYHALELNFESALQKSMSSSPKLGMQLTDPKHQLSKDEASGIFQAKLRTGGSERADGNNVDIDTELVQMTETGIRYSALSTAVSKKLSLLKNIAR